jgi:membrane protein
VELPLTRTDSWRVVREVAESCAKHRLSTHASAIAFRILVSLAPLVLLVLALLGSFGLRDVWNDSMAPAVKQRVTEPVFAAIDFSVQRILSSGTAGLIAFASLLLLWELSRAVRSLMIALNEIHDIDERRSFRELLATTLALAFVIGLCLLGSTCAIVVLPRLADGIVRAVLTAAAYAIAVVLLGLIVALLVRYGPAEHPSPRWASVGSALVVAAWLVTSALFGWWAGSVANYKSAVGSLTVFLVLSAYTFASAAVFLIGVEVDERARTGKPAPRQ